MNKFSPQGIIPILLSFPTYSSAMKMVEVLCVKGFIDSPEHIALQKHFTVFESDIVENSFTWKLEEKLHRVDGPAFIRHFSFENRVMEWYKYGKLHRIGAPAHIKWNDQGKIVEKEYCENGLHHRIDGPALSYCDSFGKIMQERYMYKGLKHCAFGPAVSIWTLSSFIQEYYIHGVLKDKVVSPKKVG